MPKSIVCKIVQVAFIASYLKSGNILFTNLFNWMVISSFSTQIYFTPIHGYYNEEESRNNPINVVSVVVVACVTIVVDIHEVRGVTKVRRTLPPVISNHPTQIQRHIKI